MSTSQRLVAHLVLLAALTGLGLACQHQSPTEFADTVLDGAIRHYGGRQYEQVRVSFEQDNQQYQLEHHGGRFRYQRFWKDSTGAAMHDISTADSTLRYRNGQPVTLSEAQRLACRTTLLTAYYWAFLPAALRQTDGQKQYLGEVSINDELYFKLQIVPNATTEAHQVGGALVAWIHTKENTLDYIAYQLPNGKLRFGQALHPQQVAGIRFQDRVFYQPVLPNATLQNMEKLFMSSKLSESGRFEMKRLSVSALSTP